MKAFYAGSFDPVTLGHIDIIKRASKLADTLVVGVVTNPNKKSMFTHEQRVEMLKAALKDTDNVEFVSFDGLLADFVLQNGIDAVVRGLRNIRNFEEEIDMAQINATLYNGKADTVFLMTDPRYSFISSSYVREVYSLGGSVDKMVDESTSELMDKFKK